MKRKCVFGIFGAFLCLTPLVRAGEGMKTVEKMSFLQLVTILEDLRKKDVTVYTSFGSFQGIIGNESFQVPGKGPNFIILNEPGGHDKKVQFIPISEVKSIAFDVPPKVK